MSFPKIPSRPSPAVVALIALLKSMGGTATAAKVLIDGKNIKNGTIAAALFVTVHTVEAHLSRIYRKLGIRSRRELARVLAAPGEATAEA
jgi:FixJ family two-component response regulator